MEGRTPAGRLTGPSMGLPLRASRAARSGALTSPDIFVPTVLGMTALRGLFARPAISRYAEGLRKLAACVAVSALVACSGSESSSLEPTLEPSADAGSGSPGLTVALGVSDVAVGPNRITFGVLDSSLTPIRVPEARVAFLYLDPSPQVRRFSAPAKFVTWPTGRAGVYVANVSFDVAGRWGLVVQLMGEDGAEQVGQIGLVVKEKSSSPAIGDKAPLSRNRTAGDVPDLSHISSAREPDPELYAITVADAVSSGKATVVTFATPAYCQTATCGPQVGVVSSIKDRHQGEAGFIHIEVYDNPNEMFGDLSKGRLSPLLEEWGLQSEPFTFVLDRSGRIASKFEGFVTELELEAALLKAMDSDAEGP